MSQQDEIKYNGYLDIEIIDNNTNDIIKQYHIKNSVTQLWLERLGAHLGGFGGVDVTEIRPYKILAFSNPEAAEYGLSSDQTSITNASSSGLTGNTYYSYGNVDITNFRNTGGIQIRGIFSPIADGLQTTTYSIASFRLATSGGTTSIGPWNSDQYCPMAYAYPGGVEKGYVIPLEPTHSLVVRWTVILYE